MHNSEAAEEYGKALKEGQREYKECIQRKLPPHPAVLDALVEDGAAATVSVGITEIPASRIIGVKSAGRITAFSPSFRPLLEPESEFGTKWISLCAAHLSAEGIHDPIECFEYYGNFYVQEGNKRVSVLRHFGATRIAANVRRILPPVQDTPRYRAYQEFLEFYKRTGIYDLQFTLPGCYGKLLERMDFPTEKPWTEADRRRFQSGYFYFTEALSAVEGNQPLSPEDALLTWLEVHPFRALRELSSQELKKTITQLWPNLLSASGPEPVVKTEPPEEKQLLQQLLKGTDHLNVAFVHLYSPEISPWTRAHDAGRRHMEKALGKAVTTQTYCTVNAPDKAEAMLLQAVKKGAQVVFTTAPQLIGPCMKVSIQYPKVRFFNCSVHQPYASVQTYYSRIYEGKFITGAIAGAMSRDGSIGYVGTGPIHGVPASINAFALGAQLTNPQARILLKWSCVPGNPTQEFLDRGIRVISNRDTPVEDHLVNEFGTYLAGSDGSLLPLGSPIWVWGQFYENVVRSLLRGNWDSEKPGQAVNLWWGIRSGVIDVTLSPELPEGVRFLAEALKNGISSGSLDPFKRVIYDQQGNLRNDGSRSLSPMELLKMDWLCENVTGSFPAYEEIIPAARSMVDLLGVLPEQEGL